LDFWVVAMGFCVGPYMGRYGLLCKAT
jgi:hypothetical protein